MESLYNPSHMMRNKSASIYEQTYEARARLHPFVTAKMPEKVIKAAEEWKRVAADRWNHK